jgi:hypothetical protein
MISSSQRPLPDVTQHSRQTDIHGPRWESNPQLQQASGRRPTPPRGHWDRLHSSINTINFYMQYVDSRWNVMEHGDAREGKWRGNWRMEWVASTLHTTSENGVPSITTADAHSSAASSRLNWRPRRFKWTRPFRRKTKSGFCTCATTFQLACTRA